MKNKKAFPESCTESGHKANVDNGMDILDYFAAKAMQGLLSSDNEGNLTTEVLTNLSYEIAETMMKVRETYKTETNE